MNEIVYSRRVVAFIDLLGFSDYIRASSSDNGRAKSVLSLLHNIESNIVLGEFSQISKKCKNDRRVVAISDSIIISYPISTEPDFKEFFNILMELAHIQYNFLEKGWLTRGGISLGNLYHAGNVIFGDAYLEAHDLEENQAKTPRILISDKLCKYIQTDMLSFLCRKDDDGQMFVNYLWVLDFYKSKEAVLAWVYAEIEKYKNNDKLKNKYIWLENYINKTVTGITNA